MANEIQYSPDEIAEMRRNDARYRWLRDGANLNAADIVAMNADEDLDKAVDAHLAWLSRSGGEGATK